MAYDPHETTAQAINRESMMQAQREAANASHSVAYLLNELKADLKRIIEILEAKR